MNIDLIFEWNDHGWCPTTTYVKFFNKIKLLRPDINFNFISSVELRDDKFTGHACIYGPFYMVIRNRDNGRYILVSYWDTLKDIILDANHCNFDLNMMIEIITSIGVHTNDIEFKPLPYLKYTPFGYVPLHPPIENLIESIVANQAVTKVVPDKPRFRNFPNDPFRQFIYG